MLAIHDQVCSALEAMCGKLDGINMALRSRFVMHTDSHTNCTPRRRRCKRTTNLMQTESCIAGIRFQL